MADNIKAVHVWKEGLMMSQLFGRRKNMLGVVEGSLLPRLPFMPPRHVSRLKTATTASKDRVIAVASHL